MHISPDILRRCRILAGPTAAGKSAVALELAERIGGEILGLDSMTLYRGMDLGTAKPSEQDRARVPHHLFDLLEPSAEFSLSEYLQAAEAACREILSRGRVPLFVGGAGLYLRGLLRGLFKGPPADWELRKRLETREEEQGAGTLHAELRRVDPKAADVLHPHDLRRVVRALEVFELTGIPLSVQQQEAMLPPESRPAHNEWLSPPREWLYARIDRRAAQMFEQGLVDEVRGLLQQPGGLGRTASQALGYKEVLEHLQHQLPLDETITLVQTRTRQFAKRQLTWFRNLGECQEIPINGQESTAEIVQRLLMREA